jgi:type I restriction-modification system DNA methylase subunit
LIGPDYFSGQLLPDEEEMRRVNPFDWKAEFPGIMQAGGFDAVIGNPPYLFITEVEEPYRAHFAKGYKTCEYRFDAYGLFIELTVRILLSEGGLISFIVPHTLLSNDSFEKLRTLLLRETRVGQVIDIGPGVFLPARNETMIFVCEKIGLKKAPKPCKVILTSVRDFPAPAKEFFVNQEEWRNNPGKAWLVKLAPHEGKVLTRMEQAEYRFRDLCTINQGLRTGDNDRYLSSLRRSEKWKPVAGERKSEGMNR